MRDCDGKISAAAGHPPQQMQIRDSVRTHDVAETESNPTKAVLTRAPLFRLATNKDPPSKQRESQPSKRSHRMISGRGWRY